MRPPRPWCTVVVAAAVLLSAAPLLWAGEPAAKEPTPAELAKTIEALKARLRAQEERIAELEKTQSRLVRREEVRKLVDEVVDALGPSDFRLYWDNGVRARTGDGRLAMKFGGRLMYDWTWADGGDVEPHFAGSGFDLEDITDGKEVRRARLYWEGVWNKRIKFKWQYDFADSPVVKDLYLELQQLPVVGHLRMGHFKEPFGFGKMVSSKYITFVERAAPTVFAPSRNVGFMIYNHALDGRLTWAAGLFQDTARDRDNDQYDDGQATRDGDESFTMRVTALPYWAGDGRRLVHAGFGYSFRSRERSLRYRQRPEAHLLPRFVDTGAIGTVDHEQLFGAELAAVCGPFHAQAEYLVSEAAMSSDLAQDDPTFQGWYVQVGYFLTGEVRPYKRSAGAFDRVKPKKNWDDGGPGAWEIAGRYSQLDLTDAGVEGGVMECLTLGLNWYLNPNVRIMWNYVHTQVEHLGGEAAPAGYAGASDDADIFLMRVQVDF